MGDTETTSGANSSSKARSTPLLERLENPGLFAFLIPAWIMVYSLLLVIIAEPFAGVGFLVHDGRQVGYLAALNWSVVYPILLPLLAELLLLLLYRFRRVLIDMVDENMVINLATEDPLRQPETLLLLWRQVLSICLYLWAPVAIATLIATGWEWKQDSYNIVTTHSSLAELERTLGTRAMEIEKDWTIGSLIDTSIQPWRVWLFTLAAYAQQAVIVCIGFLCVFVSIAFGALVVIASFGAGVRFLPNLGDKDPRRGFQKFEPLGYILVAASIVIFVASYLVVLQNQYLSDTSHTSILALMFDPVRDGARAVAPGGEFSIDWAGLLMPTPIWNYSNGSVTLASILVLFTAGVGVPCGLLSIAALHAKMCATRLAKSRPDLLASWFKLPRKSLTSRLELRWWPFGFPGFNLVLVASVSVFLSIFFYALAPFLFGTALALGLSALVGKWAKLMKETVEGPSASEKDN